MPVRRTDRPGRGTRRAGTGEKICEGGDEGCEIAELFRTLGKTYMLEILHIFIREDTGPQRFVSLQRRLSMSPNTLSDRLRELVQAGLLTRTSFNEIPPRVDYEATAKAFDLKPVFETLAAWAARHNLKPEMAPGESVLEATA